MIVKMKKLTLLVLESQRRELLSKLRSLGVIHIKHVTPPSADEITHLEEAVTKTEKAIAVLHCCALPKAADRVIWNPNDIPEKVKEITALAAEREELLRNIQYVEGRLDQFRPWGAFDPRDLGAFEDRDIKIRLYRTTKKIFTKMKKERSDLHLISEDSQYAYVAQVCEADVEELPLEEVKLPHESFEELFTKHEDFKARVTAIENEIRSNARGAESLRAYRAELEKKRGFLNVFHGMKMEETFSYLQGFLPVDKIKDVKELAGREEAGYTIEDPYDEDDVPSLIRNPRWINIISPVFKFMNTIPGYREYDISFWFLMFFSIFFAMLIGDAGYGLLFASLAFIARRKFKSAPREPFILLYVLSFATIAWGAVTGTWFGMERIAQLPVFNSLVISNVNSFVETNQDFLIYVCFVIGVIHLSIAHLIIAVRMINSLKALAQIGWVMIIWWLFFVAGTLILAKPFPDFGTYLIIGGASLVALFSNPQRNIIKGVLTSLADLPLSIISSFSDVVSYLRLFAVGYASVIVSSTFNNMALDLGFGSIAAGLGAALIIFFGHTLNIILGLMAVIVHGIRLNMLEFSGQMGMEWAGKEYNPFK